MYLVYGSEGFLCRQFIKGLVKQWTSDGYEIHRVEGLSEEIEPFLSPMLALFGESPKAGFVILDPINSDLSYLKQVSDNGTPVLLYVEGALPRSKAHPIHKLVKKKNIKKFMAPSPFKAEEAAITFAIREAERQGLVLSPQLAKSFIKLVGSDFGVVYHELLKVSHLVEDDKTLKPVHFRAVAQVSEVSASDIIEAVGARKRKALLKALASVKKTYSKDPTLMICGWLGSEARKWLLCASLHKQKKPVDQTTTGIHPYILSKKINPILKKWNEQEILNLVHCLSIIERYVKTGGKEAWTKMEGELAQLTFTRFKPKSQ